MSESINTEGAGPRLEDGCAERRVWELPVRLFHWTLAFCFLGAYITNRLGVAWFQAHVFLGYAALVLVAFRLIWGFVGARHAKFASFVKGPAATLRYARDAASGRAAHYVGHNPLGALMVVGLLAGLGVQAAFGLFADDEIYNAGPLAGLVAAPTRLTLTSWHARLFYLLAAAAAVHVVAVVAHVRLKRENIVRAMITGRKPARLVPQNEAIGSDRVWLALAIVIALGAALTAMLQWAPPPSDDLGF